MANHQDKEVDMSVSEEQPVKSEDWWNTWVVCSSENSVWKYDVYQRRKGYLGGCYDTKLFAIMRAKKLNRNMRKNPLSCALFAWEPKGDK